MEEGNTTYKLPEGWISTTIGDILNIEYGKSLPNRLRNSDGEYS